MRNNILLLQFIFILIFYSFSFGATSGSIEGTVLDAVTKEPIPGANVAVVGTSYGAITNQNGMFRISNLPVGIYQLESYLIGYQPQLKTDVVVSVGKFTEVVFHLRQIDLKLNEIVVRPSYFEENTAVPLSTQSLANEEIRRAPGGNEDVLRAIAVLPGVAQTIAGRNDLIVRGGAPSENLYVVDGHEVPNINHFGTQGASGGPLSFVNLDFVREVTFSTGGFGVLYGNRLSSVTTLDLKEGRNDRIGGKATLSATQFGYNIEGPIPNAKGSFIFSARRSYLDFVFKSAGFGFVPEYWDFLGKVTYPINPTNKLSWVNIGALDRVRFFNDNSDQRFSNSRILGSSQDQYFSGLSWQHLSKKGILSTSLTRSFVYYRYKQSDSLLRPIFLNYSREGETTLRTDGITKVGSRNELLYGVGGKSVKVRGEFELRPFATSFGDSLINLGNRWNRRYTKGFTYLQWTHRPLKQFTVNAGIRGDYMDGISTPFALSPRLSFSYLFSPELIGTISGGVYRQTPSYIWLLTVTENRNLSFLRNDQVVVGLEYRFRDDSRVRLEGYTKYYRDYPASITRPYLVMSNTGAGFGGSQDNFSAFGLDQLSSVGVGLSNGVELMLQKRLSTVPCYGIVSFSYSQTKFKGIDNVWRTGSYDQRFIANLSGGYIPNAHWEYSLKFRLGTGIPYTPYDSQGRQSVALYNSKRLPIYHGLDLRVDRRWFFEQSTLITYIDIQNIYNRKNVTSYSWNYREQKVEKNTEIGILPSIGISWEY